MDFYIAIIDMSIKMIRLYKCTLKIHKTNLFIYFIQYLYVKKIGNFPKSRYVTYGVNVF